MNAWQTMAQLLRTILLMSIAGSVAALILVALKPLIKNRTPKIVQYYLWALVLIVLLVPFSTFISIPVSTPMAPVQEIVEENIKTNTEWYEEISQEQYNMSFDDLEAENQVKVIYEPEQARVDRRRRAEIIYNNVGAIDNNNGSIRAA